MRIVIVTNMPAPYRTPVFALLDRPGVEAHVVYCTRREPNRSWRVPADLGHDHSFLKERVRGGRDGTNYVHVNLDIWARLQSLRPDVVVTTGFNPTHLLAYAWARTHGARHVCMTDGTDTSEAHLGYAHRLVRRIVFAGTESFVCASQGGARLYRSYSIAAHRVFRSALCTDNEAFAKAAAGTERDVDLMFSGRFHPSKLPLFASAVAAEIGRRRGSASIALAGDGPLKTATLAALQAAGVTVIDFGFVQPELLASIYPRARILLFPSASDPWGVVANEAMAAGTPVITTPAAGVAGELVQDGVTGQVLEPDVESWASTACRLLDDAALWTRLSDEGRIRVARYTFRSAADGLVAACRAAFDDAIPVPEARNH